MGRERVRNWGYLIFMDEILGVNSTNHFRRKSYFHLNKRKNWIRSLRNLIIATSWAEPRQRKQIPLKQVDISWQTDGWWQPEELKQRQRKEMPFIKSIDFLSNRQQQVTRPFFRASPRAHGSLFCSWALWFYWLWARLALSKLKLYFELKWIRRFLWNHNKKTRFISYKWLKWTSAIVTLSNVNYSTSKASHFFM